MQCDAMEILGVGIWCWGLGNEVGESIPCVGGCGVVIGGSCTFLEKGRISLLS